MIVILQIPSGDSKNPSILSDVAVLIKPSPGSLPQFKAKIRKYRELTCLVSEELTRVNYRNQAPQGLNYTVFVMWFMGNKARMN